MPGYVNKRIEALKRRLTKVSKKEDPEAKFRFRFLDVEQKAISEAQVCSDHNYPIILNYCATFAGELPTKKETEEWAEEEAGVLRSFASWACDRSWRNRNTRRLSA
ncbi:unnamed protein product [Symbiodinium sp. CCMP2592]|nr:unnamed protein product [Symbiodinium sp. CCMP2592]